MTNGDKTAAIRARPQPSWNMTVPMLPREMKQGRDGTMLPNQYQPARLKSRPAKPVGPIPRGPATVPSAPPQRDVPDVASGSVSAFIARHFRHYNAGVLREAADAYAKLIDDGGQMFLSMAGAMSTAEFGKSLAAMIRAGKVHGLSVTGANLEEDLFNLVAHSKYLHIPDYQDLTRQDDDDLAKRHINRVTDVGIPEKAAMTPIEKGVEARWKAADTAGKRLFPHEVLYDIIASGDLEDEYEIDPEDSWLVAAAEKALPIVVPGWEDSTLGNVFAASVLKGEYKPTTIKSGIEYMTMLADWYRTASKQHDIGFFQIGGGIAGDFAICVVPLLEQDAGEKTKKWAYFCQITDATESYGGYSGAIPSEKGSWGKIEADSPAFSINSDATVIAPLIFARVLGW